MNNFLDNLAERAMSVEQGIRPRLPSLFEPAMLASEPAWPERGEPESVEAFDVTMEREANDASPARSFSQRQSRDQVFQPDTHPLLAPARLSEESPGAGFEQASPKPETAPLQSKSPSAVDRRETEIEEKVVRRIVNETIIRPALQPSPSLIAPRANPVAPMYVSRDEAQAVEAARNESSAPLVAHPKLDRYVESPPPQPRSQTPTAPPSEQVINVTIGRIEVRATPPAPATVRSNNQKPPVMSLDDYLRQRSGGGGGV